MASPRGSGSRRHRRKNRWAALVALTLALGAAPARAQGTEAAPVGGSDSLAAPLDGSDSLAAPRDSAAPARGDTLPPPARDSAAPPARPAPPPVPVDSALGAACAETGGGPPDLLMVTFRPATTASEREAVAREVGGILVGTSEHGAPGAWYLRVPGSASNPSVADSVIVLSPVVEVGATRCPS